MESGLSRGARTPAERAGPEQPRAGLGPLGVQESGGLPVSGSDQL